MHIEDWPTGRPKPYPKDARKLSGKAVDKIAASLQEFGWRESGQPRREPDQGQAGRKQDGTRESAHGHTFIGRHERVTGRVNTA